MTSVIATIAALFMMFGRSVLRFALGWLSLMRLSGRAHRNASAGPHFSLQHQGSRPVSEGSAERAEERTASLRA
jgi:hypothetical protein